MMFLDVIPAEVLQNGELSVSRIDNLLGQLFDHAIVLGQKIILAAIIFFVGRWLIGWLRKLIGRFLEKRHIESTVKSFLDSLANITLQITLFLLIVNILGFSLTSFAAILAAAGLAIGMAMKDNLSNFAGGIMILINKPFKIGDRIVAQGMDGVVQSIGILYTVLLTGDNRTIFMPNGPLSTGSITNYSTQNERRIDITLSVSYGADILQVKDILSSVISKEAKIKQSPAPFVGVTMLNNGTIDVTIRVWVDSSDYASINVSLNEAIYSAFIENAIYASATVAVKMLKD
ncbi:mechanosensitive ion channel family protein [Dysgonomonas sp. ZJ279]|uniref:mechanosensitive ion channel family protein n=1 Tax=Dysgonomonas sp. ZJ279 TaxID=2709796 RepID=UPI002107FAC9|nr:mechanosensitive ion channel family protein [Dysgonomonas sp. ZJ279]